MNLFNSEISLTSRRLWLLWFAAFFYAFVIGLVFQSLVLPMLPALHAGNGLMIGDTAYFHRVAVEQAALINELGWEHWRLILPEEATANVGLLSALYAIFGPNPLLFLPFSAAFHALSCVLVWLVVVRLIPGAAGRQGGFWAALVFLFFPSALVWYGQLHKDAFSIAGYLLLTLSLLRVLQGSGCRNWLVSLCLFVCGFYLVGLMRPHLPMVYLAAFSGALVLLGMGFLWRRESVRLRQTAAAFALVVFGAAFTATLDVNSLVSGEAQRTLTLKNWDWRWSGFVPRKLEAQVQNLAFLRAHFIAHGEVSEAKSGVDSDIRPESLIEVLAYLPRAMQIGVLAPFPSFWVERVSALRIVGSLETLLFYLCLPGLLWVVFRRMSAGLFFVLASVLAVITVTAFVNPNLGTLHRVRFGQWFLLLAVGLTGTLCYLQGALSRYRRRPLQAVHQTLPSGSQAAGAGLLVLLVSFLGFLGLLVRDLLLIDRVGFDTQLDSYYLAIMLPMFLIAVLSAPLGDALSTRLAKTQDKVLIQQLLRAVSAATLLLFGFISLVLWYCSEGIFTWFIHSGDIGQLKSLFAVALLLLVLSGVIAAGNSLLNVIGKPVWAASAQLAVPVVVVVCILLSSTERVVWSAMLGMALGQLANLVLLGGLLWRAGYDLAPLKPLALAAEKEMLGNFQWLMLCALLVSVAVPINYWFAGGLGSGAVSTWALGSKLVQVASVLGAALMTAVFVPYMSRIVVSGAHQRVRDDLFTSLVLGAWGCVVVIFAVFVFVGPFIDAAGRSVDEAEAIEQLVAIVKLGALQLPCVMTATVLFKFCAVSSVSSKAVWAALVGLCVNVLLNVVLVPDFGLVGLAMAWTAASFIATLWIMWVTKAQSHLSPVDMVMIVFTWFVAAGVAAALHFSVWWLALPVLGVAAVLLWLQLRHLSTVNSQASTPLLQ